MSQAHEVNFDGIVGPTHNYAGLSYGNIASMAHKLSASSPRQAALEGLAKMKFIADLGVKQAVLPPHERPHIPTLRALGFTGNDKEVLEKAHRQSPALLAAVSSASAMWAANAATISPSADTEDGRVHFTPANLITQFHRSIEAPMTARILQTIFIDEWHFAHHPPLTASLHYADEGAANHMRLCPSHGESGVEVFVCGRQAFGSGSSGPAQYPARQTLEACQAIARTHGLRPDRVVFLRQAPAAIDAGVFHNDVAAVGSRDVMICHDSAFADSNALALIEQALSPLPLRAFPATHLTLADAVGSYVFNSQLVTLPDGSMSLIAPAECAGYPAVLDYLREMTQARVVQSIRYVDVRQSMQNGGGPACLRLRVVLNDDQVAAVRCNVFFTRELHDQLKHWITKHYRDQLHPDDLRDPKLLEESRAALDELSQLLQLGSIYEFQQ